MATDCAPRSSRGAVHAQVVGPVRTALGVAAASKTLAPGEAILVGENEADLASTLAFHRKRGGYDCRVVGDGQAAMAEAQGQRPDLIVLDRMLPRMTTATCPE
jgi:PleD family two-component response regulator